MIIKEFDAENELYILNGWLAEREHPTTSEDELPAIGFIVYRKDPIAVVFLRQCEGPVGILEGLCTNPVVDSKERHMAIDGLIGVAIEAAQKLEITKVIAYSRDNGTLERAKKHGFMEANQTMIVRDLTLTKLSN